MSGDNNELITKAIKNFFRRQSLLPFETMWAFFCIYVSIANALSWGVKASPLAVALGSTVALLFNTAFCLAGVGIYFGIGLQRGNVEACGLILLAMSLLVATVANGWLFGLNPAVINSYVLNGAFVFSCLVRLAIIIKWPHGATEVLASK